MADDLDPRTEAATASGSSNLKGGDNLDWDGGVGAEVAPPSAPPGAPGGSNVPGAPGGGGNAGIGHGATTTTAPPASAAAGTTSSNLVNVTARARRRREEAVRRLVADVQARPDRKLGGDGHAAGGSGGGGASASALGATAGTTKEAQDWIIASTVAAALERGLDRDLHHELVQEAKENSGRIGQVCHDHSDVFLASVGKVVALGGPSADLANKLRTAQDELEHKTAGPMHRSAVLWEEATSSHARARALHVMVSHGHKVAIHLERARKQASLGRPRAALEAVDEARTALTAPMSSLFYGPQMEQAAEILKEATKRKLEEEKKEDGPGGGGGGAGGGPGGSKGIMSLEETPFGRRASLMLPKIENEVLMGARRGLNRWFLSLRSGGDGAKAGRAVLRNCAHSMAVGPGNLGLGGHMPPAYLWRAKVCDNLISRMNQNGRVVRSVRLGYWFERDAPREAQRLEATCPPGMERRAEGEFRWKPGRRGRGTVCSSSTNVDSRAPPFAYSISPPRSLSRLPQPLRLRLGGTGAGMRTSACWSTRATLPLPPTTWGVVWAEVGTVWAAAVTARAGPSAFGPRSGRGGWRP